MGGHSTISGMVVLGNTYSYREMQAEQTRRKQQVSSVPPWPLIQFLPDFSSDGLEVAFGPGTDHSNRNLLGIGGTHL